MTATTDFIAELVRAANEVAKLPPVERGRLLKRVIATIRYMRDIVGFPACGSAADSLITMGTLAGSAGRRPDTDVRAALLEAAGMIRDLRIVMDSKIEVIVKSARGLERPTS
ncbi:hypothetical protein LJR235_004563 [Pararhizobium sp. LjRoot235]|uniref:hypothetical protein n=1 Tax=Pararhizobium sp. LjRoot235 TaxID=3342291 RepID=UPI003ECDF16B